MTFSIHRLIKLIDNNAPQVFKVYFIRKIMESAYEKQYSEAEASNLFRGVFDTFTQAELSAPKTKEFGYNHHATGKMYGDRMKHPFPSDYPVLFWISYIFEDTFSLFDYGGHVGVSYYAFKKYLKSHDKINWQVFDVAAIRQAGEELAKQQNSKRLAFTGEIQDAAGADIFFASGSLQYIEQPLDRTLSELNTMPSHLIINKTPFHNGPTFITLNNINVAFCPYCIRNKKEFIDSITCIGYQLIDEWDTNELSCHIPFHPDHSKITYKGFYFQYK